MTDENLNLARSPASAHASPLLVLAACLLASFAARAETAAAAPAAAQAPAASAPAASAAAASAAPSSPADSGAVARPADGAQPTPGQLRVASQEADAEVPPPPPDDDAPAPPPPPPPPPRPRRVRRRVLQPASPREARQGGIFAFGFGGAQQYVTGASHVGGFDADLRLGYGFSDRFQLLFDVGGSGPGNDTYPSVSLWHMRVHGQTVLFGDRKGNGLNLNLGIGFGGATTNGYSDAYHDSSQVGLALGGGISYEARVTPHFALAPEFFIDWQQAPNYGGLPSDFGWAIGARLNFVWYSPF